MKKILFMLLIAQILFGATLKPHCLVCPTPFALAKVGEAYKINLQYAISVSKQYHCLPTTRYIKVKMAGAPNKIYINGFGYYYTTLNCVIP